MVRSRMSRINGTDRFERLLNPRSVAVVGATSSPGKTGRIVLENLLGGAAMVYPVHPTHGTILGVRAYPSLDALPEVVDLLVIAVGAEQTIPVVRTAVTNGIPFVIALAGGFAETGEAGTRLQEELVSIISGSTTRLLGPNTLGIQIPGTGVDTIFVEHASGELTTGNVALVSQSGSVAVEALGAAALHGFPLRAFVGLGNAVDLGTAAFVTHFSTDGATECLCVYLEHLGEGRVLLDAAREASRRMPVFFLKAGRSAAGAAAAASHTGRLAGSDRVVDGALRQYGVQRVDDDEALLDAARAVTYTSVPRGNRVAIVTPAGGYGVMGSDYVEGVVGSEVRSGGTLRPAELTGETRAALASVCLPFAAIHNPVDLTAGVDTDNFDRVVRILLEDPGTDILIVMAFLAPAGLSEELIGRIGAAASARETTVLVFCRSGNRTEEYCRAFTAAGLPVYNSLSRTIAAARVLVERRAILDTHAEEHRTRESEVESVGSGKSTQRLRLLGGDHNPTEADAKALLEAYRIAVPRRQLLVPATNATLESIPFPGPYAVKVASEHVLHKTEMRALALDVVKDALPTTIEEFVHRFPGEDILVEEMVQDVKIELIAGALRDPDLGLALMVGAGGVLAELYRDVTFRLLPCTASEIDRMLDELALAPLLRGYRGIMPEESRSTLCDCLEALGRLIVEVGDDLAEFDVNPLAYAGGRWIALDAKIVLRREG